MTGRMDYRPNYEGAAWFINKVVPRVLSILPEATFYFVGANPPSMLRNLAKQNVTVTGAVDDIRPFIEGASVVVAPLLIARGVQNKVLEAMAMKKPVVATHQATRALEVVPGEHLWVENEPGRFSDAVIDAIRSPARLDVADKARAYVETNHDWARIFLTLDRELEGLKQWAASDECGIERAPIAMRLPQTSRTTGAKA
jgi:glycosyltransferase involved in cell wall biosynthesis